MKIQNAVYRVFNGVVGRFRHVVNLNICPLVTRLNLINRAIGQGSISLLKLADEIYYMRYTCTQLNAPGKPLPTCRPGELLLKAWTIPYNCTLDKGSLMRTRYLSLAILLTLLSAAAIRADETVTYRSARANAAVAPVVTSPQQINAVPHPISTNKPQRKYHKDPMVRPDLKYPVETYDPTNPRFILDRAAELVDRDFKGYVPCKSFVGISNTGWDPPDPHVAAGPNHVVEVVNSSIAIFDKVTGEKLLQATAGFWFQNTTPPPASGFIFDPKVVYDPDGGHFIIFYLCTDDVDESSYLVSVSQTSDAMGNWWSYNLNAAVNGSVPSNCWPDYPGLGFDFNEAVYLTSNQWEFGGGYQYAKVRILPKFQIYSGAPVTYNDLWDLKYNDNSTAFTVKPAVTYDDADGEFLLSNLWFGSNYTTYWKITNPVLNPVVTVRPRVNIPAYPSSPQAEQKSGAGVGTLSSMTQDVLFRNGKVYTAFDQGFNWGSGTVCAIRVLGIDTASSLANVDKVFGADKKHYYFPGIYVDPADRIFLGFNRSSAEEYISIWYSEDLLATNSSRLLKAGESARAGAAPVRWGDYAGIGPDPIDPEKVWISTEYSGPSSNNWMTWVGQVPSAISQPSLEFPEDDAVRRSPVAFAWDSFSPADSYRIEIDDASDFTSIDQSVVVGTNGVTLSGFADQVRYYWRVIGISECPNNQYSFSRSFVACAFTAGDADGNAVVTISDAVFLINYIFSGGPDPIPLMSADTNCDSFVTVTDVVTLINYIFSGGVAPCDPCS